LAGKHSVAIQKGFAAAHLLAVDWVDLVWWEVQHVSVAFDGGRALGARVPGGGGAAARGLQQWQR
jgi:hypothetical protein